MSRHREPLDYGKRTQHGDPAPSPPHPGVLSADELAGIVEVKPVTTGPIAPAKRCGKCGGAVSLEIAICQTCVPGGKPTALGGRNG